MKPLRDIPNQRGFRFVGIGLDGSKINCIVDKDAIGCFCVYRESDREPCFFQLIGWEPLSAAERNDGSTPETDALIRFEFESTDRPFPAHTLLAMIQLARTLEQRCNGLAARVVELERAMADIATLTLPRATSPQRAVNKIALEALQASIDAARKP